jgi:transposase InsO family protein
MKLPRSSYYYHAQQQSIWEKKRNADLQDRIEQIICEFPGYGYRRVTKQLLREGMRVNHKKVLRIMRESSLLCAVRRSYKRTTNSQHPYPRYPNLIKGLIPSSLNEVWIADITYIRIATSFVYLSVILDSISRKVIGYALSDRLNTELALTSLRIAIAERRPAAGCIHHSDQGVQYASLEYVKELKRHGFLISMASTGNPYENAQVESFFKTLKYEEVNLWNYRTLDDVVSRIPYFIQEVYNTKRLHSSIGYVPPEEYEASIVVKEQNQKSELLSAITK